MNEPALNKKGRSGHEPRRISPTRSGDPHRSVLEAGFTLFDVLMALMILALVASVAMPGLRRPAGPLALRTTAYQLAAILREARTAAIGTGRPVEARVEGGGTGPRVTAGRLAVDMPSGILVGLLDRRASAIRFAPDGTTTGGTFLLRHDASALRVSVNADTGAIDLAGL